MDDVDPPQPDKQQLTKSGTAEANDAKALRSSFKQTTQLTSSKRLQWTPQLSQDMEGDEQKGTDCGEAKTTDERNAIQQSSSDPSGDEDTSEQELRKRELLRKAKMERLDEKRIRESAFRFNYSRSDYPVREWQFSLPFGILHPVVINPLVTGMAIAGLWGLVIWGAVNPTNALNTLVEWRTWISLHFTWFFQGSTAMFIFFMLYIVFRFGHVHLGPPCTVHEPPEFSTGMYICMIFSGGVGAGFFTSSVSQALSSQAGHYYAEAGYRTQDEVDLHVLLSTLSLWTLSSWIPYLIVGVNMSLAVHCYHLPLALRSCLFPILKDYTWGWMGDCVDALAIVSTVAGVTTSLGLGAIQIVSGFVFLGWVDENATRQHIAAIQNATIWVIIVISCAMVLSGLYGGVRLLSGLALFMSCLIMFFVLIMDDTKFICNLIVQEVGQYLQHGVFLLNFWTDAFGQLREGSGRAVDGNAAAQWWMDAWTTFFLAWWITWSAFVGVFIASISRGRTINEVVLYALFAPTGYCLVWFSTMGGAGLRQARQALELQQLGAVYFNNSDHFQSPSNSFCFDVPQETLFIEDRLVFTNYLPGVTPVCLFDETKAETAAFNVLNSLRFPDTFGGQGLGSTMTVLFILATSLYCVTSCDSACLVVDNLASSGRRQNHWARRVFWSLTIGSLATMLLSAGGDVALRAIQAASVLCGLPFTLTLCFMTQSILLMCRAADRPDRNFHYTFPDQPEFSMPIYGGIYNLLEYLASVGRVNPARVVLGMHRPNKRQMIEACKGLVVPFVSLYQIVSREYPDNKITNGFVGIAYAISYVGWLVSMCTYRSHAQFTGLGWTLLLAAGSILSAVRSGFRNKHRLRSSGIADLIGSFLFWPQVLTQMQIHGDTPPRSQLDQSETKNK